MDWDKAIAEKTKVRGVIQVEFGLFESAVLDRTFGPFPYFAGFFKEMLFVSEDYPEDLREPVLWHEAVCNFRKGEKGRCLRTTREELEHVPADRLQEYVRMRADFYEALLPTLTDGSDLKAEITASLEYLQTQLAN